MNLKRGVGIDHAIKVYLVIRNTKIPPEIGCWSPINALH